ncbi:MAG: FKBP-type peptidyl-prolyl cis-trans isomerase [Desulfobacteraceae bacterium]|nr:FKBP-type peptidyl-prolyl cis-trans isomerase [Desulfobacteraceae bacterium]
MCKKTYRYLMVIMILSFLFVFSTAGFAKDEKNDAESMTLEEKISYAVGYSYYENLNKEYKLDIDAFFKGIEDSIAKKPVLDPMQMKEALVAFQEQIRAKQREAMLAQAQENKAQGEAFLKENKKKKGVVTLDTGLQYKVINKGSGKSPKPEDTITCHYKGTLIDGTEFDSSYKRGKPAVFQLNRVIKGWTDALQLMKPGSKWELYISSDLAYGDRQAGPIKPGSTLIFEVELVSIEETEK